MPQSPPRLYAAIAFGTIATSGLMEATKGIILPHMIADLSLSPATGAAILSAGGIGFLITSSLFGTLTQRFSLKRVMGVGAVLAVVTLTLFLTTRSIPALYAAGVAFGMGGSLVELTASLPISLLYQGRKQESMLNLLHGFFGLGTLLGSLWAAFWMGLGVPWQVPLTVVGLLQILWTGLFLLKPAVKLPRPEGGGGGYGPMLRDAGVWAAAGALAAAVAVEAGLVLWLPSFLQQEKGLSEPASALYATVFFIGFTATRLVGSWLVNRFGAVRLLVGLALMGMVSTLALRALPGTWTWLVALSAAGMAVGFATCVALVSARYPDRVNRVYSLMYTAGGLAGITTGPLMGWIAERAGLAAAIWVPVAGYGALAGLMAWYGRQPARAVRTAERLI